MDIEQMRLLFNLSNEQVKLAEDYFLKAENAEILHCEMHDIEWMDFEPGCYACIQERCDFQNAVKPNAENIVQNAQNFPEVPSEPEEG